MASQEGEDEMREWKYIGMATANQDGEKLTVESLAPLKEIFAMIDFATTEANRSMRIQLNDNTNLSYGSCTKTDLQSERLIVRKVSDRLQAILSSGGDSEWDVNQSKIKYSINYLIGDITKITLYSPNGVALAGSQMEIYGR